MKYITVFILIILGFITTDAQTLYSSLEKDRASLGEKITFVVHIQDLQGNIVKSAPKNELLPFHFEEIKDSEKLENNTYERKIEFQIFEEGEFTIPPLEFIVGNSVLKTIPYTIKTINTHNADEEIEDIVANREVEMSWIDYWHSYKFYVLVFMLFIALIIVIIGLKKFFSKTPNTPKSITHQALKELEKLRKKDYINKGETRLFYVELIDLLRHFILIQYKISADVLLTEDLLAVIKKSNVISKENETKIEEILKTGDQVKFAKIFPKKETMEKHIDMVKEIIKESLKDIEAEQLRVGV